MRKHEEIHSVLEMIKAGAKAPKYNYELCGWRRVAYKVLNLALVAALFYLIYKFIF